MRSSGGGPRVAGLKKKLPLLAENTVDTVFDGVIE